MKKYDARMIDISFEREQRGTWASVGTRHAIKGVEYVFDVKDRNYDRLNGWSFVVRKPQSKYESLIVQPIKVPGKKVWASLDRRSIVFERATIKPYTKKIYCKVTLADPTMSKNKVGTRKGQRDMFPKWFDYFRPYMRLKETVATTKGRDGNSQVVIFEPDDIERMIRLFFATKVWVLQEGFVIE